MLLLGHPTTRWSIKTERSRLTLLRSTYARKQLPKLSVLYQTRGMDFLFDWSRRKAWSWGVYGRAFTLRCASATIAETWTGSGCPSYSLSIVNSEGGKWDVTRYFNSKNIGVTFYGTRSDTTWTAYYNNDNGSYDTVVVMDWRAVISN
eukprot:TRINITY_DN11087_c0_g1_i1.p1 TRINITY_DN11087_c0_g1~~TRINITY_DN11087_c0_g1_i1.p1  ORF type:complete len:148 (-),score=6.07 TRINITY_DN11087_c0_g1_i1:61-504(-)